MICANRTPDHTTIARLRQRHEGALAELFGEVLWLCADAGLVRVRNPRRAAGHPDRRRDQIILRDWWVSRGGEHPPPASTAETVTAA